MNFQELNKKLILNKIFGEEEVLNLVVKVFCLTLFVYLFDHRIDNLFLTAPLMILLIFGSFLRYELLLMPFFWFSASFLLSLNLFEDWYHPANHHFLLFFICLILCLTLCKEKTEQKKYLAENMRLVILILMFFATFQKLSSSSYLDGGFFGYIFIKGGFFRPLLSFFSEYQIWQEMNSELIRSSSEIDPNQHLEIQLTGNPKLFSIICKGFSYLVFIAEFLVLYIFWKIKNNKVRHIALILLIIGIFITRLECGFLSILCGIGICLCGTTDGYFCRIYLALILLFNVLIILDLGFS